MQTGEWDLTILPPPPSLMVMDPGEQETEPVHCTYLKLQLPLEKTVLSGQRGFRHESGPS